MCSKLRLAACLAGIVAPWLLTTGGIAGADEVFTHTSTIPVAGLKSFDIGFVDPVAGVYVLADRSNKSIDVVDTSSNTLINQLAPGFVGATPCPPSVVGAGANDCAGPDGVLIVNHTHVWVGDGNSTVWVLHLQTGKVIDKISTAIGGPGTDPTRADELCLDSKDHIILMANDASVPAPFVTFISSTGNHEVLGRIVMDGSGKPGTGPKATGGIEQCQWSPRTGKFYLNLPEVDGGPKGAVLVIDPESRVINQTWIVDPAKTNCTAPQGMAIGPAPQILLGCNGAKSDSLIINEDPASTTLVVIHPLAGLGGNDEVWYNPGDNQYFLANTRAGLLGVADPNGTPDKPFPATLVGSHSVAADPVRNQVYVPFNDGSGIGVYTTAGPDDPSICVGQGAPVISAANEGTGDPVLLRVVCPPKGNN